MLLYCPDCNKNVKVVELYRTRATITYLCVECGRRIVVGIWR